MGQLYLQPTSTAYWYALVNEAEADCRLQLGEDLESYLVFLLMRFSEKPEMAKCVMALEFLESLHAVGSKRHDMLKEVGDKCLLFSGLFPEQVKRRRLKESYFIDMGQNAYYVLASMSVQQLAALYQALSEGFLSMHEVLKAMRHEACELFDDSNSRRAGFVTYEAFTLTKKTTKH